VSDNYLYVGTIQGKVLAYDLSREEKSWVKTVAKAGSSGFGCSGGVSAASGIYGTPGLRNGKLYIGAYDGTVLWISADGSSVSGSSFDTKGKIVGSVAIDGDTLYVGSSNGKLFALDLNAADFGNSVRDGWPFKTGGEIWSTPVVSNGVVYIASADHNLYAVDAESGAEIWRFETEAAIMSTPLVVNDMVYIGGCDRRFYSIKAATDKERAAVAAGEPATVREYVHVFPGAKNWFWTQALAYNGQIWVGSLDKNIYVLNADDLGYIAEIPTKGMVYAPPVSLGGKVIVGSQDGWIYVINPDIREFDAYAVDSKTYEAFKAPEEPKNKPAPIFAPMFADQATGMLYFHAQGNKNDPPHRLYALAISPSSAEVRWSYRTDNVK
jgi:outer membrane protein assembly factor BamB